MKKTVLIYLLVLAGVTTFAQQKRELKGIVYDTLFKQPLAGATVKLYYPNSKDTLRTLTTETGEFSFKKIIAPELIIQVSFTGYGSVEKKFSFLETDKNWATGRIDMGPSIKELDGVRIESPAIKVKEDTIEYRADAYKTKVNAVTEDLLRKLPGVEVDKDGNIKAHGKEITRILLNGKPFFGDDIQQATKNLPANIIDKIQVIDKKSEKEELTGIRDGNSEKVINIQLKKDKNKGIFGNANAGIGSSNIYQAAFSASYFNEASKITVFGTTGNNNSVLGNNRFASRGGVSSSSSGGINFRVDKGKKLKFNGSYSVGRSENENANYSRQQRFLPDSFYFYTLRSTSNGNSNRQNGDIYIEWNPDSLNYIRVTGAVSGGRSRSESSSFDSLLTGKRELFNITQNRNNSGSENRSINTSLYYLKKFSRKGRNLSLQANFTSGLSDGSGETNSLLQKVILNLKDTNLLRFNQEGNNNGFNAGISYTEPIGKANFISLNYYYNRTYSANNRATFRQNLATGIYEPSISQSNNFYNNFNSNQYGLNYQLVKKIYNLNAGISFQPVTLSGFSLTKDSAYAPQKRVNINPNMNFSYRFSSSKRFNMYYYGYNRQPSLNQLQPITDSSNPLNIYRGNPFLRPEFYNNINAGYNSFNAARERSLNINIGFNITGNKIINTVVFDPLLGRQATSPLNINGIYGINSYVNYSQPLIKKKLFISSNSSVSYNRNINFTNAQRNIVRTYVFSPGLGIRYEPREWITANLNGSLVLNSASYSLPATPGNRSQLWNINTDLRIDFPKGIVFNSSLYWSFNRGLANGFNRDLALLNASIEKQFFSKKQLSIVLRGVDLLNQNTSVGRRVTENQIEDFDSFVVTRYFYLSVIYKLDRFGGKNKAKQ
jgi:Outer membrane protein beta-barrel family